LTLSALGALLAEHSKAAEHAFAVPRRDCDDDRLWLIELALLGWLIFKLATRI
jgi:hypothetical protein